MVNPFHKPGHKWNRLINDIVIGYSLNTMLIISTSVLKPHLYVSQAFVLSQTEVFFLLR